MYSIDPPQHNNGYSNGSVTIERDDNDNIGPPMTETPSKASSVRVANANLRYYDPSEFDVQQHEDDGQSEASESPTPTTNTHYHNTSYEQDEPPTIRQPELV